MAFRWISMFSGAGCGDLGLHRAGHEIVAGIENDKQAAGVFAYNFPDVPLFSDIEKVEASELPDADGVLYSFPCQDLSLAGKRKGIEGERSNLYGEAIRIISDLKERGLILSLAENVAGLMSSGDKDDFARLVKDLSEVGHREVGWTHLDSQHIAFSFPQDRGSDQRGIRRAVPQRRLRVFVLGTLVDLGAEAIEEIFTFKHRVSGHFEEGRKARKAGFVTTDAEKGTGVVCDQITSALQTTCFDYSRADNFPMVAEGPCYENHGQDSRIKDTGELSPTITKKAGTGGNNLPLIAQGVDVYNGSESGDVSSTLTSATGISNGSGGKVCCWNGDITPKGKEDVCLTLRAQQGGEGIGVAHAVALAGKSIGRNKKCDTNGLGVSDEGVQYTLTIADKHAVAHDLVVRRITPLEAERLQGLTDNFTKYREELELVDNRWIKKGKVIEVKDGPRYKMLGNGITAHVLEWIARRISLVTKI
ncbi:DNA methyltransferase [uncultured Mediterranean phage uvMED]|nr:DNA methyltransferase [uncultured Mediterranean phage uvMED]